MALVGYTNAGKSSLLAALVNEEVESLDADDEDNKFSVDDKVFATLDPLTRRVQVADQTALVTDTVGFVSKLPAQVVAAFRATLEEVSNAAVIVHVVDASAPRHLIRAQVPGCGSRVGCARMQNNPKARLLQQAGRHGRCLFTEREGGRLEARGRRECGGGDLGDLREQLAGILADALLDVRVTLPYDDASYGGVRDEILNRGRVFSEAHGDAATDLVAAVPWDLAGRLRPYKGGGDALTERASSRRWRRARSAVSRDSRGPPPRRERNVFVGHNARSWRVPRARAKRPATPTASARGGESSRGFWGSHSSAAHKCPVPFAAQPNHAATSPKRSSGATCLVAHRARMVRGALWLPGGQLLPREPGALPHGGRGPVRRRRAEV